MDVGLNWLFGFGVALAAAALGLASQGRIAASPGVPWQRLSLTLLVAVLSGLSATLLWTVAADSAQRVHPTARQASNSPAPSQAASTASAGGPGTSTTAAAQRDASNGDKDDKGAELWVALAALVIAIVTGVEHSAVGTRHVGRAARAA
jgi:hypothetical protein